MAAAGYPDAEPFLQGSSVSRRRHSTGQEIDTSLGNFPNDYDMGLVSPMLSAAAGQHGISDAWRGHLNSTTIGLLRLTEAQNYLTLQTKTKIPVNFKLYRSFLDVYETGQPTIPLARYRE